MDNITDLSLTEWALFFSIVAGLATALTLLFTIYQHFSNRNFANPKLKPIAHTLDKALTGRADDIKAIRKHFEFSHKPLTIHGGPGIGKTVLARELAQQHYIDRWVMLPLSSESGMKTSLEPIASQLKIEDKDNIEAFIRNTLEAMRKDKSRWLVILDNADTSIETERARKYALNTNDLDFIVTSQLGVWPESFQCYPLAPLLIEDATALLSKLSGRPADENLRCLAENLDRLPLALTLIGTDLGHLPSSVSVKDYADSFTKRLLKTPVNERYSKSVTVAVSLAVKRLSDREKKILYLAAFMDPNDISAEHFLRGAESTEKHDHTLLASNTYDLCSDKVELNLALAACEDHSLLYPNKWRGVPTRRIHRTTQWVLRQGMSDDTISKWVVSATQLSLAQIEENPQLNTKRWLAYHRLAPHLQPLLFFASKIKGENVQLLNLLANRIAQFLSHATTDQVRAMEIRQRNIEICEATFGRDSSEYGIALGNLALSQDQIGRNMQGSNKEIFDMETEKNFLLAARIIKRFPDKNLDLANYIDGLASFYWARDNLEKSELKHKRALNLRVSNNATSACLGTSYDNLGTVYHRLAKSETDKSKAKELYHNSTKYMKKALFHIRSHCGELHFDTAICLNNLAVNCFSLKDYNAALEFRLRSVAIVKLMSDRGIISCDHPRLALYNERLLENYEMIGLEARETNDLIAKEIAKVLKTLP